MSVKPLYMFFIGLFDLYKEYSDYLISFLSFSELFLAINWANEIGNLQRIWFGISIFTPCPCWFLLCAADYLLSSSGISVVSGCSFSNNVLISNLGTAFLGVTSLGVTKSESSSTFNSYNLVHYRDYTQSIIMTVHFHDFFVIFLYASFLVFFLISLSIPFLNSLKLTFALLMLIFLFINLK